MIKEIHLRLPPEIAGEPELLAEEVIQKSGIPKSDIRHIEIARRSIDARGRKVVVDLRVQVYVGEHFVPQQFDPKEYPSVAHSEEVHIIGMGPAGLFAALQLIARGKKPVILERGKDARNRIADLKQINVHHVVHPDSNYCFGEGGAGTYSDGKLYTRSKKRGDARHILEQLVAFGASKDILVNAHPHIGTNKLPGIIANIRRYILAQGGEIHFETRISDFVLEHNKLCALTTLSGLTIPVKNVILATGHSARDIFELLHRKKIKIEAKPLAVGVRVEHAQSLIDSIQYSCEIRSPYLPPSPYSIVRQVNGRGVYSFCMCPGGVIAPCATEPGEIVTNGWSSSRRARATANSGIVVELRPEDFASFHKFGPLAAMMFQKEIEQKAWNLAGKTQAAPAQRLVDFTRGKISDSLPSTSYAPGISSVDLREVLPDFIYKALRDGFKAFDKSMRGYLTNEAVVHAPETRTSSPVSIPRNPDTLQHIEVEGLYPCGEGAGYAGGIVSAAMDGIRCANAI